MSLRNKMFVTFSLLLLIPLIVVGMFVQNMFLTLKSEEVINNVENTNKQLNFNLDLMIEDASRSSISLLYNKELISILQSYSVDTPIRNKKYSHATLFSLFLSGITFNKDQIYGMHVFTNNGLIYSHMDNSKIEEFINLKEQEWYKKARAQKGGWIIYYDRNPVYYKNNIKEYVSFLRLLRDPNDQNELGVIRIDFHPKYLNEITNQLEIDNWLISTSLNEPLFGNQNSILLPKCDINKSWIKDELENEYLCLSNKSNKTGLKISNIISKDYLFSEIRDFNKFLLYLIGICLIVSLLISYYVTNLLLKPLELLKTKIRLFRESKLNRNSIIQSKDEVLELRLAYDGMLSEIDDLVTEVYETNLRTSEAEYKALQSQMDPHFIFNTLESINMRAITKDQYEISDMIVELGKLIRYRLKNEEQQIPLSDEIIFAKTYVNIMKNRLEDALNTRWDIDEELVNNLVPKYIIQPLIENSIMHSYSAENKVVNILVKLEYVKSAIRILVIDDGCGISEEKLKEINQGLNSGLSNRYSSENKSEKGGIALININRRLTIINGNKSRLLISSEVGIGTTVEIIIEK